MNTIIEKYDLLRVAYVYENIDIFFQKESQEDNKKQTLKFLELLLINDGVLTVKYHYAKYTNYGRKYSYGIQGVKRGIRNFLLANTGVKDYDIKSAHPCILYYLCIKHQIHTEKQMLKNYVLNKDDVIEKYFIQESYQGKDIKKLILTATNSDEFLFTKNEWITEYQKEMVFIRDELKKVKGYKKILQDTEKLKQDQNNLNSSFVNRILCKVESEIIDKFTSFTGDRAFALMFDGILVQNGDDELLSNYNYFVKQAYGDYFNIVEKPISTDIDMGDYEYNIKDILGLIDNYETRMNMFIENFNPIKIINPALYGIIQEDGTYEFYKKDAFIQSVEHIRYTNIKGDNTSIVGEWLKEKITSENTFTHIITDPTYDKKDKYNLWREWDILGWDGEFNNDEDVVQYMKHHLLILCNYDEGVAESMELWISHLLKYPKSKSFVPIFIGKQGAGKDMFFAWIEMMIGAKKKFETSTPEKHIWGGFNPFMKSAYLIHLSEFGRKNTQDYVGQIKAITTTGKICINEKNKGEYEIDSYHRFIGASNFAEPIPIESDNRRYLLIHTSPDKIGDTEYFEKGWGYLNDKNAIKSMFNYFMQLEPPENFKYHMIKETEYMEYLKDISRPQEECWLEYYVNNNKQEGKIEKKKTLELYENYLTWCGLSRQSYKMEKRKFLIQLKITIGNNTKHIQIKKTNGMMVGIFDWDSIQEEGNIHEVIGNEFDEEDEE
jgi:hypothetical protein